MVMMDYERMVDKVSSLSVSSISSVGDEPDHKQVSSPVTSPNINPPPPLRQIPHQTPTRSRNISQLSLQSFDRQRKGPAKIAVIPANSKTRTPVFKIVAPPPKFDTPSKVAWQRSELSSFDKKNTGMALSNIQAEETYSRFPSKVIKSYEEAEVEQFAVVDDNSNMNPKRDDNTEQNTGFTRKAKKSSLRVPSLDFQNRIAQNSRESSSSSETDLDKKSPAITLAESKASLPPIRSRPSKTAETMKNPLQIVSPIPSKIETAVGYATSNIVHSSITDVTSDVTTHSSLPAYKEICDNILSNEKQSIKHPSFSSQFSNTRRESATLSSSIERTISVDDFNDQQIHQAAMEGTSRLKMESLVHHYGVNCQDIGGRTPLMYAVLGNQPKMCTTLLKLNANRDSKDLTGLTPLLWAAYQAKPEIMSILLKNGANVRFTDQGGRTAFHWVMKTPNSECLKCLLKFANIPDVINKPDNDGLTCLHWAVMSDQAEYIRLLLTTTEADSNPLDKDGRGPLNYAVLNSSPNCIRAILDSKEEVVKATDIKGRTVLHYACAEGSLDCVTALLSYPSCDIHSTDNIKTTPLHWAAAANQPNVVRLLLSQGANKDLRDIYNSTPIDYAIERGHDECVAILQSKPILTNNSAAVLDVHGHVQIKIPKRNFSLTETFIDRLPADGQAQSEVYIQDDLQPQEVNEEEQWCREQNKNNRTQRSWKTMFCCCVKRSNVVEPL